MYDYQNTSDNKKKMNTYNHDSFFKEFQNIVFCNLLSSYGIYGISKPTSLYIQKKDAV